MNTYYRPEPDNEPENGLGILVVIAVIVYVLVVGYFTSNP